MDACAIANAIPALASYSFDEVNGGTIPDRSGNGRDATLVKSPPPVVVPGVIGNAFDFGATDAYLALPNTPLESTRLTVSLWFFESDPTPDESLIYLPMTPSAAAPRLDLWLTDRSGAPSLCINTGESECWGITDPRLLGRWVHVVAEFANGSIMGGRLSIDGAPVTMGCQFSAFTCDVIRQIQNPLSISGEEAFYAWHGLLDEVRFFDGVLSPEEVSALHACR